MEHNFENAIGRICGNFSCLQCENGDCPRDDVGIESCEECPFAVGCIACVFFDSDNDSCVIDL